MSEFYVSIGRPPCSVSEANLLLTHMLEYDDCAEVAGTYFIYLLYIILFIIIYINYALYLFIYSC
jgi:hypothetical protein